MDCIYSKPSPGHYTPICLIENMLLGKVGIHFEYQQYSQVYKANINKVSYMR